jgi:hypothetical protein
MRMRVCANAGKTAGGNYPEAKIHGKTQKNRSFLVVMSGSLVLGGEDLLSLAYIRWGICIDDTELNQKLADDFIPLL